MLAQTMDDSSSKPITGAARISKLLLHSWGLQMAPRSTKPSSMAMPKSNPTPPKRLNF
jgi:hypothetical protein